MSITRARAHLQKFAAEKRILEFAVSSATVELAAAALGCEGKRIAKSLSFYGKESPLLVVAAGDARVDNKKFRAVFGVKAKMLPAAEVEAAIGHDVGGVCPFGVNEGVNVYLDVSLKRFDTVFPACGSSNSAIELTIAELETFAAAKGWVDICNIPE